METDGTLLRQFAENRDESAFEALFNRHGAMVMGVCRQTLGDPHEAEDAFQATFMVLARKARKLYGFSDIGGWLHKTALYVSLRARTRIGRQRARKQALREEITMAASTERESPRLLQEELARLSEKLRSPLVLCYIEGVPQNQAAERLGISLATLKRHLVDGKKRLEASLGRKNPEVSSMMIVPMLGNSLFKGELSANLLQTTLTNCAAALGGAGVIAAASPQATALMKETLNMLFWTKVKTIAATIIGVTAIAFGSLMAAQQTGANAPEKTVKATKAKAGEKPVALKPLLPGGFLAHAATAPLDKMFSRIDHAASRSFRTTPLAMSFQPGVLKNLVMMGSGLPAGALDASRGLHAVAWWDEGSSTPAAALVVPFTDFGKAVSEMEKSGMARKANSGKGYVFCHFMPMIRKRMGEHVLLPVNNKWSLVMLQGNASAAENASKVFASPEGQKLLAGEKNPTENQILAITMDAANIAVLGPETCQRMENSLFRFTRKIGGLNSLPESFETEGKSNEEKIGKKRSKLTDIFKSHSIFKIILDDERVCLVTENPCSSRAEQSMVKSYASSLGKYAQADTLPEDSYIVMGANLTSEAVDYMKNDVMAKWRAPVARQVTKLMELLQKGNGAVTGALANDPETNLPVRAILMLNSDNPASVLKTLRQTSTGKRKNSNSNAENPRQTISLSLSQSSAFGGNDGEMASIILNRIGNSWKNRIHGRTLIMSPEKQELDSAIKQLKNRKPGLGNAAWYKSGLRELEPRQIGFCLFNLSFLTKSPLMTAPGTGKQPVNPAVAEAFKGMENTSLGMALGVKNNRQIGTIAIPYSIIRWALANGVTGPYQQINRLKDQLSEDIF